MQIANAISAVVLYVVFIAAAFYPIRLKRANTMMKIRLSDNRYIRKRQSKLSFFYIILFSLGGSLFNKFVGFGRPITQGDRLNYLVDFNGRQTGNPGFDYLLKTAHIFTNDFFLVLYGFTFIFCILLLISYRISDDTAPASLLIMMCTPIILDSFTALKQCCTVVFALLMFAALSRPKSLMRDVLCVVCVFMACLFHSTGYLLAPIFLVCRFCRRIDFRITIFFMIVIALFLKPFGLFVAAHTSSFFPRLSVKLYEYFEEGSWHESQSSATVFLKGIPYYIAAVLGLIRRKNMREKDEKYDMYLFILCLGAIAFACSMVSYWLIRVTSLLFFPISIAIYKILASEKRPKYKMAEVIVIVGGLLFFTLRSITLNILNFGGY